MWIPPFVSCGNNPGFRRESGQRLRRYDLGVPRPAWRPPAVSHLAAIKGRPAGDVNHNQSGQDIWAYAHYRTLASYARQVNEDRELSCKPAIAADGCRAASPG